MISNFKFFYKKRPHLVRSSDFDWWDYRNRHDNPPYWSAVIFAGADVRYNLVVVIEAEPQRHMSLRRRFGFVYRLYVQGHAFHHDVAGQNHGNTLLSLCGRETNKVFTVEGYNYVHLGEYW